MSAPRPTLEDRVFGPDPPKPPPPEPSRSRSGGGPPGAAAIMVPVLATVFVSLLLAWSLQRGMDYSEMFLANRRYRLALIGGNCAAVAAAMAAAVYSARALPF